MRFLPAHNVATIQDTASSHVGVGEAREGLKMGRHYEQAAGRTVNIAWVGAAVAATRKERCRWVGGFRCFDTPKCHLARKWVCTACLPFFRRARPALPYIKAQLNQGTLRLPQSPSNRKAEAPSVDGLYNVVD